MQHHKPQVRVMFKTLLFLGAAVSYAKPRARLQTTPALCSDALSCHARLLQACSTWEGVLCAILNSSTAQQAGCNTLTAVFAAPLLLLPLLQVSALVVLQAQAACCWNAGRCATHLVSAAAATAGQPWTQQQSTNGW